MSAKPTRTPDCADRYGAAMKDPGSDSKPASSVSIEVPEYGSDEIHRVLRPAGQGPYAAGLCCR
jgi:hypothetical protein